VSGRQGRSFLTSGEAAGVLGVSRQTILRWARSGAIAATHTLGGHLRFHVADISSFRKDLVDNPRQARPSEYVRRSATVRRAAGPPVAETRATEPRVPESPTPEIERSGE
jgi:excisionase family DNA binding protein